MKRYFVYIMADHENGTIYIGVTNDLIKRVFEHRGKFADSSFTKKYALDKLVYYEIYENVEEAIKREKVLKNWKRAWKIKLVNEFNPGWKDLYEEII